MPKTKEVLLRHTTDITAISTSHGVGVKRVLATNEDIGTPITQIARTVLRQGEIVANHTHPTMDEHFYFIKGTCIAVISDKEYSCSENDYLFVPAGISHQLKILSNMELITIGVAYDK